MRLLTHTLLTGLTSLCLAGSAAADSSDELQKIVAAQQEQIRAQSDQIAEQGRILQELRQHLAGEPPVGAAPPSSELPGGWTLPGTDTVMSVGGFVWLQAIHDDRAITSECDFVTSSIVTRGATKVQGSNGQTNFCTNGTRLWWKTLTPFGDRRMTTYVETDFFGNSDSPEFHFRQAYAQLTDAVLGGDLLVGQAWSTFVDLGSFPNTLDFEGVNASLEIRQPLVRWTRSLSGFGEGLSTSFAIESGENVVIENADALTLWPDAVWILRWDGDGGHVQGGAIARQIRGSASNGPIENDTGYGLSVSGMIALPYLAKGDNLTFQGTWGSGIGSYFDDAPPDAVFDPAASEQKLIPVWGGFVGLQHFWIEEVSSTLTGGYVNADNRGIQADDAFHTSVYASGNLIYTPFSSTAVGIEYLFGKRRDKDGADGTDSRVIVGSQVNF
jgi:hypothetical protein